MRGKFGGAAMALADPWTQMKNVVGDVAENFGSLLLPTINVVSQTMTSMLGPLAGAGDGFQQLGLDIAQGLGDFRDKVASKIDFGAIVQKATAFGSWFVETFFAIADAWSSTSLAEVEIVLQVFDGIESIVASTMKAVGLELADVPMFFRNATPLIETSVLDWNLALFELVPGTESVMENVGKFFVATWDGIAASAGTFVQNILDGLREIGNVAQAVWAGIKATFNSGSFTKGYESAIQKLASQQGPEGKQFATEFSDAFSKTWNASAEGFKDQGGLAATYKARKNELVESVAQNEESRRLAELAKPSFELPKIPAFSVADYDPQAIHSTKDKKSKSDAALAGSKEANMILLKTNNDPAKKIDETNKILGRIEGKLGRKDTGPDKGDSVANFGGR